MASNVDYLAPLRAVTQFGRIQDQISRESLVARGQSYYQEMMDAEQAGQGARVRYLQHWLMKL